MHFWQGGSPPIKQHHYDLRKHHPDNPRFDMEPVRSPLRTHFGISSEESRRKAAGMPKRSHTGSEAML